MGYLRKGFASSVRQGIRNCALAATALVVFGVGAIYAQEATPPSYNIETLTKVTDSYGNRLVLFNGTRATLKTEDFPDTQGKQLLLNLAPTNLVSGEGADAVSSGVPGLLIRVITDSKGVVVGVKGVDDEAFAKGLQAFLAGLSRPKAIEVGATWKNEVAIEVKDAPPVKLSIESSVVRKIEIVGGEAFHVALRATGKGQSPTDPIRAVEIQAEGKTFLTAAEQELVLASLQVTTKLTDRGDKHLTVNSQTKASTTAAKYQDWIAKNWFACAEFRRDVAVVTPHLREAGLALGLLASLLVPGLGVGGCLAARSPRGARRWRVLIVALCSIACIALGVGAPLAHAQASKAPTKGMLSDALALASRATAYAFAVATDAVAAGPSLPAWLNASRAGALAAAGHFQVAIPWDKEARPLAAPESKTPPAPPKKSRKALWWTVGILGAGAAAGGAAYALKKDDGGGGGAAAPTGQTGQSVIVSQRNINLTVLDPDTVDGDRVDLILNGTQVLTDQVLVATPGTTIAVALNAGVNTLVIHADNTGATPPNRVTLQISHVTSGPAQQDFSLSGDQTATLQITAP